MPTDILQIVDELRDTMAHSIEVSEGAPWPAYVAAVARTRKLCDDIIMRSGDVPMSVRLPIRPETIERRVNEFDVPDTPEGLSDGGSP